MDDTFYQSQGWVPIALIPDYLLAEMSSVGLEWHGVELESPSAELFTNSGQQRSGYRSRCRPAP